MSCAIQNLLISHPRDNQIYAVQYFYALAMLFIDFWHYFFDNVKKVPILF